MLTDFPRPKVYNLGGLTTFEFVHFLAVDTWPGIFDSRILSPITLKTGYSWLKGYSTPLTLSFSEPGSIENDGKLYQPEISGFAPGDSRALIQLMEEMEGHEFIIKIRDTNNQIRIVGSHGFPLTFSAGYASGGTRDEAKGYNFKFSGRCIFRAPVI